MRGSSVEPGLPNTWVTPSVRRTSKRASRPVRGMGATVALGRRDRPRRGHRAGITARAGAARYHRPPLGTLLGLLVVVALIGANAAFTAGEYAFVAADRSRAGGGVRFGRRGRRPHRGGGRGRQPPCPRAAGHVAPPRLLPVGDAARHHD